MGVLKLLIVLTVNGQTELTVSHPPTAIWNHFRGLRRLARNGSGTPEGAGYYTVPSLAWNHMS